MVGRGNRLEIERLEVERGGHGRFVEHGPEGVHGFQGRYREVTPPERLVQTFEWDGMPGYVVVETVTFEIWATVARESSTLNPGPFYPTIGGRRNRCSSKTCTDGLGPDDAVPAETLGFVESGVGAVK